MINRNYYIHLLTNGLLILLTIAAVFFGYEMLTDQKNDEVEKQVEQEVRQGDTEEKIENPIQKEEVITARNLFYVQLDDNAKIMYKALEDNQENMKSGDFRINFGYQFNDLLSQKNGAEILNQSFQSAWNAYRFDHMEVFYLDISNIYLFTKTTVKGGKASYEVSLGAKEGENYLAEGFETKEKVIEAEKFVNQQIAEIKSSCKGTDEEKVKYVHDWLVNYVSYGQNPKSINSPEYDVYGALIQKSAVCEGYARAFKLMLDELNIPCLLVAGTGVNSNGEKESHAWNYVFLDNTWYAVDVTWDDPVIIGGGTLDNKRKYEYYLKGSDEFFQNHTPLGRLSENSYEFLYPELSKTNYNK